MVMAALLVGFMMGRASAGPDSAPAHRRTYVVRAGDTVWAVATRETSGDPRPVVDWLIAQNHLTDGLIVPGQRLVLPG